MFAACLVSLVAACGSGADAVAAGPGWHVTAKPFRLEFVRGGKVVAQEPNTTGGPGGRLGYVLADDSYHGIGDLLGTRVVAGGDEYHVSTDESSRTAYVTVRKAAGGVSVSVRFAPATDVAAAVESFESRPGEHFLGGGERPGALDLRGQALAIKVSNACQNRMPAPFYASTAGYGVALDSSAIAALAFPGADPGTACAGGNEPVCPLVGGTASIQLCVKAPRLAYRVFFGNPQQVVSAYTKLVGRPRVPPASQFALIKWRDEVGGADDLYADVAELRKLGVPVGWILLDNPWESGLCYGSMQFDAAKFPDPAGMIRRLHSLGVRFMLWVSPLVRKQWCPAPPQYAKSSLIDGGGSAYTLDLTDPATLHTFESSLEKLVALGVDGFKGDRGDEFDLESVELAGGPGGAFQNTYPLAFDRAVAAAVKTKGKTATFATMFRAASPGSAAVVPGFWGGDQQGTFAGLQQAIHDGLSAGLAGYAVWGSDTGGYASAAPPLTPEVFVRWAQFSAVSPIFEVGGVGKNATFWDFGSQTVGLFRQAAVLHYELFPYLDALARTAHVTGQPILRPLALAYPGDANAWTHDLEALVGPDLLAAPVTESGTKASVYLPKGSWVDLASGATVRGGGAPFVRPTPLAELPLYLRAGGAIPFAARTPAIWPKPWPVDALTMPGRGGWLYAPRTGRTAAADPRFGRLLATSTGSSVDLRLVRAPSETQVLVAGKAVPTAVRVDGRVLPRAASEAALRTAREGWLPFAAPFRGVVLKLAPRSGGARVHMAFG
jgi:alpha-glucosidase (family GH31 glycosyl hydrolase)